MLLTKEVASVWGADGCNLSRGVAYGRRVHGRFKKLKRKHQRGRRQKVGVHV